MLARRFVLLAAVAIAALPARALTADELIAKNVEARGGLDKIKAIETLRIEGTRTGGGGGGRGGGGAETPFVEIRKRPDRIRSESTTQGLTMIRAYDGTEGWTVQPFGGRKDPEKLSADAARDLSYQAEIDGPLVDAAAKGNKVEYLGTEDVDGTEAHKLKVTRPAGDVEYVFLDPDYFLEIRRVAQRRVRGATIETETDLGAYEKVNGVYFPFSVQSGRRGATEKGQKTTVTKIEANAAVDEAIFRFPGGSPAAAK
jgi:hypothetical protein